MLSFHFFQNLRHVWELVIACFALMLVGYKELGVGCLLVLVFFYRYADVKKTDEQKDIAFISPSSSKIVKIHETPTLTFIDTYLSPLDKHYMVAPCDCKVLKIEEVPHKEDSERLRIWFRDDAYGTHFYLDQIVARPGNWGWIPSLLYKRCIAFVKPGDQLKAGDMYGLIRFGSNMHYCFSSSFSPVVKVGDHVSIGSSLMK